MMNNNITYALFTPANLSADNRFFSCRFIGWRFVATKYVGEREHWTDCKS